MRKPHTAVRMPIRTISAQLLSLHTPRSLSTIASTSTVATSLNATATISTIASAAPRCVRQATIQSTPTRPRPRPRHINVLNVNVPQHSRRHYTSQSDGENRQPATSADLFDILQNEVKEETTLIEDPPVLPAGWKIKDFKGENTVYLKRDYKDEKVVVRFVLRDPLTDPQGGEDDFSQDPYADMSNVSGQDDTAPQVESGSASDRSGAGSGSDAYDQDAMDAMRTENLAQFEVILSKPQATSLSIVVRCIVDADTGDFMVHQMLQLDAIIAHEQSPAAMLKRESAYQGPEMHELPEEMQEALSSFLADRGVNEELASFVGQYQDYKEQREYVGWLQKFAAFMHAKKSNN
jgi:complement component 1 Q subcomponent-binding protein, mitochondrial